MIEVKQTGHSDPLTFDVVIREMAIRYFPDSC